MKRGFRKRRERGKKSSHCGVHHQAFFFSHTEDYNDDKPSTDFLKTLSGKCTNEINLTLTKPYTMEEIKKAINQMNPPKPLAWMVLPQFSTKNFGM